MDHFFFFLSFWSTDSISFFLFFYLFHSARDLEIYNSNSRPQVNLRGRFFGRGNATQWLVACERVVSQPSLGKRFREETRRIREEHTEYFSSSFSSMVTRGSSVNAVGLPVAAAAAAARWLLATRARTRIEERKREHSSGDAATPDG